MEHIEVLEELTGRSRVFRDRRHAGERLAGLVGDRLGCDCWVLAIPAGGVPVALALARALGLPLDLAVVSKITLPFDQEAGYGAVAFDGTVRLNESLIRQMGLDEEEIRRGIERTRARIERRARDLRSRTGYDHLRGAKVILVDDGLASGFTMLTAIDAVRATGAAKISVAVPTASREAAERVSRNVETLFCANLRSGYPYAVAAAYRSWSDVSEDELARLLEEWKE